MSKIKYSFTAALLCLHFVSSAQFDFTTAELELAYQCDIMVNADEAKHRVVAHNSFLTRITEVLKLDKSFEYPFDSLKWISKKYPIDKSFRIFTWEIKVSDAEYLYFGFIQMADGRLYKLEDHFKEAESVIDEEFTTDTWLGSLYYNLMDVRTENDQTYYLLFGVNRWSKYENRKLVDVLFFTKEKIPVFGKPVFRNAEKGEADVFYNRLVFTYAADGQMTVNYNPGMEMIMYDNLIPKMSRIPGYGETMVPDGSYVGYAFDKKYWNKVDKIATEIMETAPRPNPILDQRKGKKIFGN